MFYQDQKNKWFRCDYYKIWMFLENNYSPNHNDVQLFIKSRLETIQILKLFTPCVFGFQDPNMLETIQNLKLFTPYQGYQNQDMLEVQTAQSWKNLKLFTPFPNLPFKYE